MITLSPSHAAWLHGFAAEARTLTSRITLKMYITIAAVCTVLSTGMALAAFASAAPSCEAGQSLLAYSRYDRRGIVTDVQYRCGQPHATCAARGVSQGNTPTYDCSPFVLPKGTLSW